MFLIAQEVTRIVAEKGERGMGETAVRRKLTEDWKRALC